MVPIPLSYANDSPSADEPRARPSRIRRASATGAALALLMLAFSTPAQASPTWLVVLEVENQGEVALLEWDFAAGVGASPNVDTWVVTKWSSDGQTTQVFLPGSDSSYVDGDVQPGLTYVYTLTYEEQGIQGLPSNPALFRADCELIVLPFRCNPPWNLDLSPPVPIIREACLCFWPEA